MIQIATFRLPDQQAEVNSFLKAHRPEGQIMFINENVHIVYEDGTFTPEHEISDLEEMIITAKKMRWQQTSIYKELEFEHTELLPRAKKKEELEKLTSIGNSIKECEFNFANFDRKIALCEKRIAEIKKDNPEIFA